MSALLIEKNVRNALVQEIRKSPICTQEFSDPSKPRSLYLIKNPYNQDIRVINPTGEVIEGCKNCFIGINSINDGANLDKLTIYIIPADKQNQKKPENYTQPTPH
jgi:hypothetical protein